MMLACVSCSYMRVCARRQCLQVAVAKLLGRRACPKCHKAFNTGHIIEKGYDMPALPPPSTPQVGLMCLPVLLVSASKSNLHIITTHRSAPRATRTTARLREAS